MDAMQSGVLARAGRELPAWRKKLPAARPRLFFTAETWSALRGRYAASTGRERLYFEAALARARQIVTQPRPVYRTPEEMMRVDPSLTPLSASEELWQRVVGNDLVTLSLALALEDDAKTRDKLRENVLTACSYPQWGWPGLPIANRDLACGHLARGIADAYDWHPDLWTEADRTLIRETIRARVEAIKAGAFTPDARSTIDSCVFSPGWAWTSADLTGAYDEVTRVRRGVLHRRGDYVLVFDEVATPAEATVEWLAQVPPEAAVAGDGITAAGKTGALEIRPLLPAKQAFIPRAPTSEKNDVPADRLKTYALAQKGMALRFATALTPRFGDGGVRVRTLAAGEAKSGRQEFIATGADWRDTVTFDPAADAKARVLAVRRVGERVDSLLAVGALEIPVDASLTLQLSTRADLALQLTPAGAWELDAGTDLELTAPLPAGWRLVPANPDRPPSANHFRAGHYSLRRTP